MNKYAFLKTDCKNAWGLSPHPTDTYTFYTDTTEDLLKMREDYDNALQGDEKALLSLLDRVATITSINETFLNSGEDQ